MMGSTRASQNVTRSTSCRASRGNETLDALTEQALAFAARVERGEDEATAASRRDQRRNQSGKARSPKGGGEARLTAGLVGWQSHSEPRHGLGGEPDAASGWSDRASKPRRAKPRQHRVLHAEGLGFASHGIAVQAQATAARPQPRRRPPTLPCLLASLACARKSAPRISPAPAGSNEHDQKLNRAMDAIKERLGNDTIDRARRWGFSTRCSINA